MKIDKEETYNYVMKRMKEKSINRYLLKKHLGFDIDRLPLIKSGRISVRVLNLILDYLK